MGPSRIASLRYGWLLPFAATALVAILARDFLPVDETRYVGVAWEMWVRGDYLVPTLNGMPYSHKPPLLFWLFQAGWWLFGVNEITPRLIEPVFSVCAVAITILIANRLWSRHEQAASVTPWILSGTLLWILITPVVMFDMLLTTWVLLTLLGLLLAMNKPLAGFTLVAVAIALGLLTKGPIVFVYVLVPALALPLIAPENSVRTSVWYLGFLGATAVAVAVALMWVYPAAMRGGEQYANEILFKQVGKRIVNSTQHPRPFWWYTALLPVFLFPWFFWGPVWKTAAGLCRNLDWQSKLLITCFVPSFLILSLISGKGMHYIVPVLPTFSLFLSRALSNREQVTVAGTDSIAPVSIAYVLVCLGMAFIAYQRPFHEVVSVDLSVTLPLVLLAVFAAGTRLFAASRVSKVVILSLVSMALLLTINVWLSGFYNQHYSVRDVAGAIVAARENGTEAAHYQAYHGQYQFLGRLLYPLPVIPNTEELRKWSERNPSGLVVSCLDKNVTNRDLLAARGLLRHWRSKWVLAWPANIWQQDSEFTRVLNEYLVPC